MVAILSFEQQSCFFFSIFALSRSCVFWGNLYLSIKEKKHEGLFSSWIWTRVSFVGNLDQQSGQNWIRWLFSPQARAGWIKHIMFQLENPTMNNFNVHLSGLLSNILKSWTWQIQVCYVTYVHIFNIPFIFYKFNSAFLHHTWTDLIEAPPSMPDQMLVGLATDAPQSERLSATYFAKRNIFTSKITFS